MNRNQVIIIAIAIVMVVAIIMLMNQRLIKLEQAEQTKDSNDDQKNIFNNCIFIENLAGSGNTVGDSNAIQNSIV